MFRRPLPKSLCLLPEAFLMNSKASERCLQNSSSPQTVEGTDLSFRRNSWQKRFQWPLQRDNHLGNRPSKFVLSSFKFISFSHRFIGKIPILSLGSIGQVQLLCQRIFVQLKLRALAVSFDRQYHSDYSSSKESLTGENYVLPSGVSLLITTTLFLRKKFK
jgi:hypothetical protein